MQRGVSPTSKQRNTKNFLQVVCKKPGQVVFSAQHSKEAGANGGERGESLCMSFRACWLAAQEADKDAAEIHSDPSDFSPIELP